MSAGDTLANTLFSTLTSGVSFALPAVDLSAAEYRLPASEAITADIPRLSNEDLTAGQVSGDGTFDVLMRGVKAQLEGEFKAGRITGAEYTKAYIALTQEAIQGSVQFLLGRDQAYWQAVVAQAGAVTARVQLQTAMAQLAAQRYQASLAASEFALTKMKLATEEASYEAAAYQVSSLLPANLDLVKEQKEAARAQTLDTRTDGIAVNGSVGMQKALYSQQITSYKRDAENKAAKIFADAFTVIKTLDEGAAVPDQFTQANISSILLAMRNNLSL